MEKHKNQPLLDSKTDGVDRRGFLKCMAWAGTGVLCQMNGGVVHSESLNGLSETPSNANNELHFVQISDSHMGFNKAANQDVAGTFKTAVEKINALPVPPEFILHTGDISHLSKPEEFDAVEQILKSCIAKDVFYVPGEHDVINDENATNFLQRFGKGAGGVGWRTFEKKGVRFFGLVNVLNLKAGGLGWLGSEQLEWLEKELRPLSASTPIVVFAHIPLWSVYPQWGWGTEDSAQALRYLKRFGSVTVLNGHIHQTMQKVEGHVTFHTAASTAFPQPHPGQAENPGPMKVPADELKKLLGITEVSLVRGRRSLAIVDSNLV